MSRLAQHLSISWVDSKWTFLWKEQLMREGWWWPRAQLKQTPITTVVTSNETNSGDFKWLCLKSVLVLVFLLIPFSVLFFPSVILLVNKSCLIKAEITPYLIYTGHVAPIRSSSGLFLCFWLTCGIAMAWLWPRSGKQEWDAQG